MDKETIMQLLADGVISNEVAARYFPELKESRDERIRQFLIRFVRYYKEDNDSDDFSKEDCLAWLEKQGEQKPCMIQWKGDNLKEVIDFTGKDKNFEKWFKSFEEYEKYVQEHDGIFKLFNADGSHYEVPVGAWIVKTPDGYNVASKAIFRQKPAWSEEDKDFMYDTLSNLTELKDRYGEEYGNVGKCIEWLKSLKGRVQPQLKQEWSEDDEIRHKTTLEDLEGFLEYIKQKPSREIAEYSLMSKDSILITIQKDIDWFRTLKERMQPRNTWKPSDEQIKAIRHARSFVTDDFRRN